MKATDYVKNVLVTEARDFAPLQERFSQVRNIRLLHGILGLCSEMSEIQEMAEKEEIDAVNLKEEMGDLYWYMGIMANELQLDVTKVFTDGYGILYMQIDDKTRRAGLQNNVQSLTIAVGKAADLLKKNIMYGKPLNVEAVQVELTIIDGLINGCLSLYNMTGGMARERNIEKLRARYGEKFTEAAALERDLKTEREILEKN